MPGWIDSRQVLAGAMHYFRVHPALWADRMARLAALGVTTLETYVAWNFHQRRPGETNFTGWCDVGRYIETAAGAGLDVIVRPGPYICAEWDGGGLPAWLGWDGPVALRSSDPAYLAAVAAWFDALIPVLAPYQSTRGGTVIAMQVENEYGSYGTDTAHMAWLAQALRERGVDVPLFTSDGPTDLMASSGCLPGADAAWNFGSRSQEVMDFHARRRPAAPFLCAEFWVGWFDHWGEEHHVRDAADCLASVRPIVQAGGSLNLYMAHGGTSFGTWAGANIVAGGDYRPTVTSYDSDAPISEGGTFTAKFWALRDLFSQARRARLPDPPPAPATLTPQTVGAVPVLPLLEAVRALAGPVTRAPVPLTQDDLRQVAGMTLYEAEVYLPSDELGLRVLDVADRALVFVDERLVGTVDRNEPGAAIPLTGTGRVVRLSVLVENLGRVNFGPLLGEAKGIRRGVALEAHGVLRLIHGWQHRCLDPLTAAVSTCAGGVRAQETGTEVAPQEARAAGPCPEAEGAGLRRALVKIAAPADGYLALPGWGSGLVWLNGFLLGRYDRRGPQRTLYAPAPLWRAGQNDVTVVEWERAGDFVDLRDVPDLG